MVEVFRYGHRKDRDKRVTTHVGLVARAFGAKRMYLHRPDESVKKSIEDVAERWGGSFKVELVENWRKKLKELKEKGKIVVHLTMYGINLPDVIEEVKKIPEEKLVVFVGAEKVPPEVYEIADYNIAVGNQPHSEIAALAIFLDRYFGGEELNAEFKDAKLKIIPQEKGKKVITLEE